MASTNKKILYAILTIVIIAGGASLFLGKKGVILPSSPAEQTSAQTKSEIKVTLNAEDKTYTASIVKDGSVYDVMTALTLSSVNPFIFKAKEYPGMGYLIEEINDIKGANGKYWTLYVNGKYATVGVSQYKLNNGDVIDWKYENLPPQ